MVKKLVLAFCFISLSAVLIPRLLIAGGMKERLKQKLSSPTNIQFNNDMLNQREKEYSGGVPSINVPQSALGGEQQRVRRVSSVAEPRMAVLFSYAVYKTDYKAEIEEGVVTVNGKVFLEVFKQGGVQLPLVKNSVGLIDVSINKGKAFVITQGNMYYLMIDKPGRYNLDVEFLIKATRERENGPGSFSFDVMSSPISQFEFIMPETGVEIFVEPAIKVEVRKEAKQTAAWAVLPNTSAITVRWSKALPKETITRVKLEPKLFVDTATYVSVGEGALRCQANLNYSILQSEVSNLRIVFPEDVSILDVKARDLRDWKTSVKDGLQYLEVYLNFGIKGNFALNLTYERKALESSGVVEIPWIRAEGVEREKGYFGLAAATNVELGVNKIEHASLVDVRELPGYIWSSTASPLLLAFKYLNHPFNIRVEVTKHPEVPVLVAAIDSAEYVALQTAEGKSLSKAIYQVRNNVKQFLRLNLPKEATLWSVFVAGKAVKPATDKNGSILIPLEKSQFEKQSLTRFPVEIVYLNELPKMGLLGCLKLSLPKTDIPTSKLEWTLYLPQDYIYFGFGGDVKRVKEAMRERLSAHLKKAKLAKDRIEEAMKQEWGISEQYTTTTESKGVSSALGAGALPIKIDVPTQGKLYRFSKLLVTEKDSPWLSMGFVYCFIKLRWLVWLLILAGIVVIASGRAKKIISKKNQ